MKKNMMVVVMSTIIVVIFSIIYAVSCGKSVISEEEPQIVEVIEHEAIKPWGRLINKETGEVEWGEYKLHYTETNDDVICADYDPESEWFGTIFISDDNHVVVPSDWRNCGWPGNTYDHLLQQAGIDWQSIWFYKEPSEITGHEYLLEVIEE
jgi:hypothetical protein